MSSILDALKKLEAEKAEANKPPEIIDGDAGDELIGRSALRSRMTIKISPTMIAVAVGVFVLFSMAASVGISMMLLRPANEPVVAQAAVAPVPVAAPVVEPQPVSAPVTPAPVVEPQPVAASVTPPPAPVPAPVKAATVAPTPPEPPKAVPVEVAKKSEPEPQQQPKPAPAPKAVEETKEKSAPAPIKNDDVKPAEKPVAEKAPEEEPVSKEPAEPVVLAKAEKPVKATKPEKAEPVELPEKTAAKTAKAEKPAAPESPAPKEAASALPESIFRLPVLRRSEAENYGLDGIQINMVRPPDKMRPYGSAIINLETVHTGEKIPGTDAVLIAVEKKGIAIEIEGSKDRYHIPFGWR